jgi:alkylation response protein AidB-like acyl-CoA dehydrogenase
MDFSLPEEHRELAALTRRIATDHATPDRLRSAGSFDRALWTALGSAGVLDAGLGLLGDCAVLIELGRTVAPVPYLASVVLGGSTSADRIATAALSEEDNDDPRRPTTTAERSGSGWVLTGAKTTVPAGSIAATFLVPASVDSGVTVFRVSRDAPGVTVTAQELVDGRDDAAVLELAGAPAAPVDDLSVEALVGRAIVATCAHQLGVVERALELTAGYARTRVQFGRPIGEFQAVAQRLADAYIDVEAVRLTMWQAAWRLDAGLAADAEIATAKFWAADAGHRVAHTAVHVHGGVGIDLDHPLHRYFVAAKRNEFTLGAATVQLRRLGAALAVAP